MSGFRFNFNLFTFLSFCHAAISKLHIGLGNNPNTILNIFYSTKQELHLNVKGIFSFGHIFSITDISQKRSASDKLLNQIELYRFLGEVFGFLPGPEAVGSGLGTAGSGL